MAVGNKLGTVPLPEHKAGRLCRTRAWLEYCDNSKIVSMNRVCGQTTTNGWMNV